MIHYIKMTNSCLIESKRSKEGVSDMAKTKTNRLVATSLAFLLATLAPSFALTSGNTFYVPIYSHVYHGNVDWTKKPEVKQMAVMVSVRNTDMKNAIQITSIKYYDSEGKLVRDESAKGKVLAPMASMELFVENKDTTGGAGANYIISFTAKDPVNPPVIEAVHTNFWAPGSVAFTTRGEIID
ncbi:MAG: DUF3124 domain-containing protein [Methylocystaceae bacterium]|nr:DUF3124 domain-containing protein [Methylocystaceae bacterium]